MKDFDDFLSTFTEQDAKAVSQEVIAQALRGKEDLPMNDRVVILTSVMASLSLWKEMTRRYHDWLTSQEQR